MDWSAVSPPARERTLSDGGSYGTCPAVHLRLAPSPYTISSQTRTWAAQRYFRVMWDTPTPNYKSRIAAGDILNNVLLEMSSERHYDPSLYSCTRRFSGGEVEKYTSYSPHLAAADLPTSLSALPNFWEVLNEVVSDPGSLRHEAVTESFARVDVSELEMLASLGEMPETVEWFRDVLRRLIGIVAAFKKKQYLEALKRSIPRSKAGLKKSSKKVAGFSEDSWMELRYAIRPLIFEVKSYLEALDTRVETAYRKTARSKHIETNTSHIVIPSRTDLILPVVTHRETTTTRMIRAGVLYSLAPDKMGWWTHLGLDAPVSAVWAVTTLSFMFDWFFNIGQWIASWEPRLGLTPLTNWVVETRSVSEIDTVVPGTMYWDNIPIIEQSVTNVGSGSRIVRVKMRWVNPDRQALPSYNFAGLKTAQVADLVIVGRKLISQLLR